MSTKLHILFLICLSLFSVSVFGRLHIVEDFHIPVVPIDPEDITVVTQLSYDRLYRLLTMVKNWKGPVSAAIYIMRENESAALQAVAELWDNNPIVRQWASIHLVIEQVDLSQNSTGATVDILCKYPINILRNVGMDNSLTNYVFLLDVDFIPTFSMPMIKSSYGAEILMTRHKTVFVIPAFDVVLNETDTPPKTKSDIRTMVEKKAAQIFRVKSCPRCHKPSNYDMWFSASKAYGIQYSAFYEPYIIGYLPEIPRYDERFFGWGANKQSHLYETHAAGFAYAVLPEPYVFHVSHKYTYAEGDYKECRLRNVKRWKRFVKDMHHKYGHKCQQNETFPDYSFESLSAGHPELTGSSLHSRMARVLAGTPTRGSSNRSIPFLPPVLSVPLLIFLCWGSAYAAFVLHKKRKMGALARPSTFDRELAARRSSLDGPAEVDHRNL